MPDIKIEIYDEEIISQNEQSIVLTYTEKHTKETGVLIRRSCALIEEIQGKMLWRFLQKHLQLKSTFFKKLSLFTFAFLSL